MFTLHTLEIKYLQGVGPQRATLLEKDLQVRTVHDFLYYFPYKYIDRSRIYYISEIDGAMPYIQLRGEILSFESIGEGRSRRLIGHFADETGVIDLVWFQGIKFVEGKLKVRKKYVVFGKPSPYGGRFNIAHPEVDDADQLTLSKMGLMPYYNTSDRMKRQGLNSATIQRLQTNLQTQFLKQPLPETLPAYLIKAHNLMSLPEALRCIHFPENSEQLRRAEYRLKFEELFYIQLHLLHYSQERKQKFAGLFFPKVGDIFYTFFREWLPFLLTDAQKRVVKEIRNDMRSGRQMNRLLQGDVGSGKTMVALLSMLIALDNGFQACLMAPTEILAHQHFETIQKLLEHLPVRVELLMGSIKGKRRAKILDGLRFGEIHILIGTHAVLEDPVLFAHLGMVVIDEQHRFGVAQRARLWQKSAQLPHVLVMTATPIPRTLAMTVYGDLDVSILDELPPGRKPIQTLHRWTNQRISLNAFIRKELQLGHQIYMVYPLIKESEKIDLANLETGYQQALGDFPEYLISKVHGKMKSADKEAQMQRFVTGEAQIMVATTVIEVGVNVPNASVMVIENADRFGLSQLHQLRGRVGRGAEQSYCILVTDYKLAEDTKKRLDIMVRTCDGFEIAEADLKLRGPGDLEGTQQSGIAFDLKIANIVRDGQLLQHVRDIARDLILADPETKNPANLILWQQLAQLRKEHINWSVIS